MKLQVRAHELAKAIQSGRGSGIHDAYQPWIQVKRSNVSPKSNHCHWGFPETSRVSHFLSRGERDVALLIRWAGASDIWEQYPMFGWEHPHPAEQIHGAGIYRSHVGLERVAVDAGIRLAPYPGTNIPVVLTIDMMVTIWPRHGCREELVGVSCKPKSGPVVGRHSLRVLERLELDRRYCKAAGIRHLLIFPEAFSRNLIATLIWISPSLTSGAYRAIREGLAYREFLNIARKQIYLRPAFRAVDHAASELSMDPNFASEMLKVAIWSQDLDVDVDRRLSFAHPLSPGGRATKARLASLLFGGLRGV